MMKILYYNLIVIFLLFVSCDKRKDFYNEINTPVNTVLTLLNPHSNQTAEVTGNVIVDSLKSGFTYKFKINSVDENILITMSFGGDGNINLNGQGFSSGQIETGTHNFEWSPSSIGWHNFTITITDSYNISTEYEFNIFVFNNKLPYTTWELEHVGNLNPLEKRIVVSGQDADEIYGGGILYYQYIINGDTTNYPGNVFYYIFPSPGNYLIGVRAMDNNNEWGNQIVINNYLIN